MKKMRKKAAGVSAGLEEPAGTDAGRPVADAVGAEEAGPATAAPVEAIDHSQYWEDRLAGWLGLPRRRLVALRARLLTPETDWRLEGRMVVYTLGGVQRLCDMLELRGWRKPVVHRLEEPAQVYAEPGPPVREVVEVTAVLRNKRLLQARRAEGAVVIVRVRDNSNFMRGMKVPVVGRTDSNNWQYSGRLPRRRGLL